MIVDIHFLFKNNDTSLLNEAINKAEKSFSGFLGGKRDYGGYSLKNIEGEVWNLRGSAILMFKVLSILSEEHNGLSDGLIVDTYRDRLNFLAESQKNEYKYRFKPPYFINTFDKETGDALFLNEGPYTFNDAKEVMAAYGSDDGEMDVELIKGRPSFFDE